MSVVANVPTLCGFAVGDRVKLIGTIERFESGFGSDMPSAIVRFSPIGAAANVEAEELAQAELFEGRPIQAGDLVQHGTAVGTVRVVLDGLAWISKKHCSGFVHTVVPFSALRRVL